LRLSEQPERLAALLREHQQLLAKIRQKKKELQRLGQRLDASMEETRRGLQPLLSRIEHLDEQLHALFAELLARRQQPPGARGVLRSIYRILQETGVLSPRPAATPETGGKRPPRGASAPPEPPPQEAPEFVPSAAQPQTDGAAGQALRGLYRRLVAALHPDSVQQEDEKARRTEVMKELVRAYKEGDLARLIELERTFLIGAALPQAGDEWAQRGAALARTNAALRSQLAQIKDELKALRRSPHARVLADIEQAARYRGVDPLDVAVEETQAQLDRLEELLPLVQRYRDGAISLEDLAAGPPAAREPADVLWEALADEESAMPWHAEPAGRPKGRRQRRRR
jgi:hypothetical protein